MDALEAHGIQGDPADHCFEFPTGCSESPEARRRLERYLADVAPGTAFVCRSTDFAATIDQGLRVRGWLPGREFYAIGVRYLDECPSSAHRPAIDFDQVGMLERAVDLLTGDEWPRVQEWSRPRLLET